MHKAEKYAIDMTALTDEVREYFMRCFGCCRKVYNLYVNALYEILESNGYKPGDIIPTWKIPEVSVFKKSYPYLSEVDSLGLANAKIAFSGAISDFNGQSNRSTYTKRALRRANSGTEPLTFRGLKGMPKFHSKARGDFSYTTNCQHPSESNNLKKPTIRLEKTILYLPKVKKGVKIIVHRPLPDDAVIGNVTVSMDTDGRMYASVSYTYFVDMDITIRDACINNNTSFIDGLSFIGLDYSQENFYVDSEGRKANYPHYYRKAEKRLAKLQRELSHMQKDSANYKKKKAQIAKLHVKIRNQRLDFICKEARYLANTYDVVVVEDIDLRAMGSGLSLGKNLHDNGFGMFRDRLSHLLEEKGSVLVKVDKWYASTKTCCLCGYKNKKITLLDRDWTCPVCGTYHDRDANAAINIEIEGRRIFTDYFLSWLEEDTAARQRAEARTAGRKNKKKAK